MRGFFFDAVWGEGWYECGTNCPRFVPAVMVRGLEDFCNSLGGLTFGIHVNVGVDIHGDLRAVVAREFLHDFGVHAAQGEHGEVGVAQFVETPALGAELGTVLGPPPTEAAGEDACPGVVRYDGAGIVLHDVALVGLSVGVGLLVAGELRLLVDLQRLAEAFGQGEQAHAGLGLRFLEVAQYVVGVDDVDDALVEVYVTP